MPTDWITERKRLQGASTQPARGVDWVARRKQLQGQFPPVVDSQPPSHPSGSVPAAAAPQGASIVGGDWPEIVPGREPVNAVEQDYQAAHIDPIAEERLANRPVQPEEIEAAIRTSGPIGATVLQGAAPVQQAVAEGADFLTTAWNQATTDQAPKIPSIRSLPPFAVDIRSNLPASRSNLETGARAVSGTVGHVAPFLLPLPQLKAAQLAGRGGAQLAAEVGLGRLGQRVAGGVAGVSGFTAPGVATRTMQGEQTGGGAVSETAMSAPHAVKEAIAAVPAAVAALAVAKTPQERLEALQRLDSLAPLVLAHSLGTPTQSRNPLRAPPAAIPEAAPRNPLLNPRVRVEPTVGGPVPRFEVPQDVTVSGAPLNPPPPRIRLDKGESPRPQSVRMEDAIPLIQEKANVETQAVVGQSRVPPIARPAPTEAGRPAVSAGERPGLDRGQFAPGNVERQGVGAGPAVAAGRISANVPTGGGADSLRTDTQSRGGAGAAVARSGEGRIGTAPAGVADVLVRPPSEQVAGSIYRESSIDEGIGYLPGQKLTRIKPQSEYFSDKPEAALGQGKNTGIVFEFDRAGFKTTEDTSKPSASIPGSPKEFIGGGTVQEMQNALRSVTVKPGAQGARSSLFQKRLESLGWSKTTNADGSITWRRPNEGQRQEKAEVLTAAAPPPAAPPGRVEPPRGAGRTPRRVGLAASTRDVQSIYESHRDLIGEADPRNYPETQAESAYTFIDTSLNRQHAAEVRARLPKHLQMNIRLVPRGRESSGANAADIFSAIGPDKMAENIQQVANLGPTATLRRTADYVERNPHQFAPEDLYAVRKWRAAQDAEIAPMAKGKRPQRILAQELNPGDKMTIAGEEFRVLEQEGGTTRIKDGIEVELPNSAEIAVDKGSLKRAPLPWESPEFKQEEGAGRTGIFGQDVIPEKPMTGRETGALSFGGEDVTVRPEKPAPSPKDAPGQKTITLTSGPNLESLKHLPGIGRAVVAEVKDAVARKVRGIPRLRDIGRAAKGASRMAIGSTPDYVRDTGPAGKQFVEKVEFAEETGRIAGNRAVTSIKEVMNKTGLGRFLSRDEYFGVGKLAEEGRFDQMTPKQRAFIDAFEREHTFAADAAQHFGIKIYDPKTNSMRDMKRLGKKFWPNMPTREAREAIEAWVDEGATIDPALKVKASQAKIVQEIIDHRVATKAAKSVEEAVTQLYNEHKKGLSGFMGGIEVARGKLWPEKYRERDPLKVIESYFPAAWRRIGEVAEFGVGETPAEPWFKAINREAGANSSKASAVEKKAREHYERVFKGEHTGAFAKAEGTYSLLTKIGFSPFTTIKQFSQLGMTAGAFPMQVVRGAIGLLSPKTRRQVRMSSAVQEDFVRNVADLVASGPWRTIADVATTASGMKPVDGALRRHAAISSWLWAQDAVRSLSRSPDGFIARQKYRQFENLLGVPESTVRTWAKMGEIPKGSIDRYLPGWQDRVMVRATKKLHFEADPSTRAHWGHSDIAKMVSRLRNFSIQMARRWQDWIIPETMKGNPWPLLATLTAFGLTGEAWIAATNWAKGKRRPEDEGLLRRLANDVVAGGTFGLIQDAFRVNKSGTVTGIQELFLPVISNTMTNIATSMYRMTQSGEIREELEKLLQREVTVIRRANEASPFMEPMTKPRSRTTRPGRPPRPQRPQRPYVR